MLDWLKSLFAPPQPTGPPHSIRKFTYIEPTLDSDIAITPDDWRIRFDGERSARLYEVKEPGVDQCVLTYRAEIRTEGLNGQAYLEMWCRIPGRGEFFSKGLQNPVSGTTDWKTYEIPFFLKKGQKPDLIKLNLAGQGKGTARMRKIELTMTPMSS